MKRISLCESWVFWEKEKSEDSLVQESGEECGKRREQVTLPHDAMQGQGRAADAPSGSGEAFFLGGSYVYERRLWAPKAWENEEVLLEFEGVYPNAAVYVNGERAGGCRYGYSLFRVPLEHLRWGADNEIRVEVDGSRLPNSRWYPGAGIYRPVWLLTGSRKAHIEPDGIRVTTLSCGAVESRSETQAEILIEVSHTGCQSRGSAQPSVRVLAEIYEWGQERKVTEAEGEQIHLVIPEARLWDENSPALYECRVSLWDGEKLLDTQSERFGIRRIGWSPQGLTVNGRTVKLRGGCLHHDNGILGARSFAESEYRRIRRLKEWGFNAIRSAHNPACRALLEACDELGVYVMDEAWDVWDKSKTAEDYAGEFPAHYEEDLASMAAKDYNHPSVILYSIGNEMTEPAQPEGVVLAEQIIRKLKACDGTRPVTAGVNLTLLLMAKMGVGIPSAEQPESPAA
ncbi:MAG: glycoside hydrolase family 2 TIM barrel-domain containing protein [Eubacteriales bacterium]|nr:glycoside hydrolase family 2 TIM barrel-domain containing protein [Eubacteriales bacterium]